MDSFSISVNKPRLDTPIDLELSALPGTSELIISKIGPLWESTQLQLGLHVVGANFTPFTNLTPAQALYKLQHIVGTVTLQLKGKFVSFDKQEQSRDRQQQRQQQKPQLQQQQQPQLQQPSVGLTLYNVLGWCRISHSEGHCRNLPTGWRLTALVIHPPIPSPTRRHQRHHHQQQQQSQQQSMPHILIHPEAFQATQLLRDAIGTIQLTAIPIEGLVTTVIIKPNQDTKIGVRLKLNDDEALSLDDPSQFIYIRKITPGGLLDRAITSGSSPTSISSKASKASKSSIATSISASSTTISSKKSIWKHKLVSINGITTFGTVDQANQLIKGATHRVILETLPRPWGLTAQQLAEDPPLLQPGQVLATLYHPTSPQHIQQLGFQMIPILNTRQGGSRLVLSHIDRTLAKTWLATRKQPMMLGMHLVSINSNPIQSTMTMEDVAQLVRQTKGMIHIVASPIIVTIDIPPVPSSTKNPLSSSKHAIPLGLTLVQDKVGVVVGKIHDHGRLASSPLQPGQKILSINGQPCPLLATEAIQLLKDAYYHNYYPANTSQQQSSLQILALDVVPEMIPEWPPDCLVTATVTHSITKDDSNDNNHTSNVGLEFQQSIQGRVVISQVSETGWFAKSSLQVGLVVVSINGVPCPPTPNDALQLLLQQETKLKQDMASGQGTITVLAAKSKESAIKTSQDKVGITLGSTSRGIIVADLEPQGLFQWGVLKPNQRILKINGQSCPDNLSDAVALWKTAPLGSVLSLEAVDTLPISYEWPKESLVQVTVTKTRIHQYVGLRIIASSMATHRIVIWQLEGLLAPFRNQLLPGMILVSINGKECPKTCHQVLDFLQSFPADQPLVIVAAKTVTYLHRRSAAEKWGLTLNQSPRGHVIVQTIDPQGIVATLPRSRLKVGQRILDINGTPCPPGADQAGVLLQKSGNHIVLTTVDALQHPWSAKEEILVMVHKKSVETRVGLGLIKSVQGRIAVSSVDGRLFSHSKVQPGFVIVAINGRPCPSTPKETTKLIQQTVGDLVMVFAKTIASAKKKDIADPWGITLDQATPTQGVVIHSIEPDSLLAGTGLMAQQKILTINGVRCPPTLQEATNMLANAGPRVTIEAVDAVYPWWDADCLHTVSVHKRIQKTFIGLEIEVSQQGRPAIARIDDKGIFANKDLYEGQVVVSINGKPIETPRKALQMLQQGEGLILLTVADTVEKVQKQQPHNEKMGLAFELHAAGDVRIRHIDPEGIFRSSRLLVGQQVVSINQTAPTTVREAVALLTQNTASLVHVIARDVIDTPTWPKEGLVTAIVQKQSVQTNVGIEFAKSIQGRLVISSLSNDGLLAKSDLAVGQVVLSINENPVPESPDKAIMLITESQGEISIIATNIVATATKTTKDQATGLTISKTNNGIVLSKVDSCGLFASSFLQNGQLIREINGKKCPTNVSEVATILRETIGPIKLVVVDSLPYKFEWPHDCLTTVQATKHYPGKFVGLELQKSVQGRVAIRRIDEKGIFAGKDLIPGEIVVSINGTPCPDTAEDSIRQINHLQDDVTLVVAKSVVTITKDAKNITRAIGLSLGSTNTQGIFIRAIDSNGMFANTPIIERQRILTINGKPCPDSADAAMTLLENSKKMISMEAVDVVESDHSPEEVFTAVVKTGPEKRYCGIEIVKSLQDRICIGRVDDGGCFARSGLVPGHIVVSINGIDCPKNVKKALDLLGKQGDGDVGICVATTVARVDKRQKDEILGLSIERNRDLGICVHSVNENGLFGSTKLREKQKIVSINDRPCPSEVKAAVVMLHECKGSLKVLAVDAVRPAWPSECILTTSVQKVSDQDYVGVEFQLCPHHGRNRLIVSRIDGMGLFANSSSLMVGQVLLSINGVYFPMSPREAYSVMNKAGPGQLTLVTAKIIAQVDTKGGNELGISLGKVETSVNEVKITVTKISQGSIFESTLLKEGQRIVRINGKPCPSSLQGVIAALKGTVGVLSIEAVEMVQPIPGVVNFAIQKPSADAKLGLRLKRSMQGRVVISKIEPGGLLANSPFRVGHEILSINQEPCPEFARDAVEMITAASNVVSIAAASTIARVPKTNSRELGLSLGKNSNGVVIYNIMTDGAFALTSLRIGQKVVAINGKECPREVEDAIRVIKEANDFVELETVDVLNHSTEEGKKTPSKHGENQSKFISPIYKQSTDVKLRSMKAA